MAKGKNIKLWRSYANSTLFSSLTLHIYFLKGKRKVIRERKGKKTSALVAQLKSMRIVSSIMVFFQAIAVGENDYQKAKISTETCFIKINFPKFLAYL